MGKGSHGHFQGTAGSSSAAHTLNDNLPELTKKYPLSKDGYFAPRGKRGNYVRIMKCKDPLGTAKDFYILAAKNHKTEEPIPGGKVATMRDESSITFRRFPPLRTGLRQSI